MFLEVSVNVFNKLKKLLDKYGILYQISDCTLPGEQIKVYHISFEGSLSKEQIQEINKELDKFYREEREKTKVSDLSIVEIEENIEEITSTEREDAGHDDM